MRNPRDPSVGDALLMGDIPSALLPPVRRLRVPEERPGGIDRREVGQRLQFARTRFFRTASDAARAMGIAGPTYLSHENGTRSPRADIAAFYARQFGVAPEWLLYGVGNLDDQWINAIEGLQKKPHQVGLSISSLILPNSRLIVPKRETAQGVLLASTTRLWMEVVRVLSSDWSQAYQVPADRWEQIVAGAFEKAGYDEVTLTPRSADLGRDVIAIKRGVGCVKVIGSVKAYGPHNLVPYDAVRALVGVLNTEQDTSKGLIATTSDFPPLVRRDRLIKQLLPTRLELMNGTELQKWLTELYRK